MSFTVTANSPSAGHIAWAGVHLVYNGVDYAIANGSTNQKFVFWRLATPGVFQTSNTHPSLTKDDAIVFLNKGGVPISVLTATAMDGDLVVPGTVTATAIATDAIAASHIQSDAVQARHIIAGAITAEKIAVTQLSAISANLGTMTAGNFTLDATGFIRGGATSPTSGTGFWMGNDGGTYKFRLGTAAGARMTWDGSAFNIFDGSGNLTISSGVVNYSLISGKPASLSAINATEGTKLLGVETGATRNVNRGEWATGVAYAKGDIVTRNGSSWTADVAHTAATGTNEPPTLPTTSNSFWKLSAAKGDAGASAIVALLSNDVHVFPANSAGDVSAYTGSGTAIYVYEGATALTYDGVGTANGTWKVTTAATNITVGAIADSGTFATVGDHSGVASNTDVSSITYTITGKTTTGVDFTLTKAQTFSKSKTGETGAAGATGAQGPQGPAVVLVSDRPASFTSTDGNLDGAQANIVFTANVSGIASPTYAWSFSGLQTNPTASTTNTQTITAAQFGTSKSAIVTVTVNGTIVDKMTIVRLERSTAEAGATVGADNSNFRAGAGINLIPNASLLNSVSPWTSYINTGAGRSGSSGFQVNANGAPKGYGSAYLSITGPVSSNYDDSLYTGSFKVPCAPGERIELQAKVQVFRGNARLECAFFDSNGNPILFTAASNGVIEAVGDTAWSTNLADFVHLWGFVTAPANAASVYLEVRVKRTTTSMNTDLYVTQPYIGKATANQSGPTQWTNSQPYITSGNASTYIANAAIGAAQIGSVALVGVGNFQVKSSLSGQRMEMDSRVIKIFDASGVKRVQIGDLTV